MSRRKKSASNPRTVVGIIQDRSSSMASRRTQTISGFNEYLETLQKESKGEVLLTLTQFNTVSTNLYTSKAIAEVEPLTLRTYQPAGATALYDAVVETIHAMDPTIRKDDKIIVVIMTDGEENSSVRHRFLYEVASVLDAKRQAGWEILFLGAGEDAWDVGRQMGFDYNHSINYSGIDAHDHSVAFRDLAVSSSLVTAGATAKAASTYLSTSPTKIALETKAQSEGVGTASGDLWVPDSKRKPRSVTAR